MTLKVSVEAERHKQYRAVYRTEAVDDSGQPSMSGPWQFLPEGKPVDMYIHRGARIVIEEYDRDRHGRVI